MIYIGIGSNLGTRIINIEKAKYFLNLEGIKIIKSSSYYETLSWPDITKPKFINIIIQSDTKFTPDKLLSIFKSIERRLGRKKSFKNSPRTCDIDIISYNQQIFDGTIVIPHKKMHKRNFVLIPLFELDKDWVHPKLNRNIVILMSNLTNEQLLGIKIAQ